MWWLEHLPLKNAVNECAMLWISDATSALPGRRMSLQAGLILIHDNNSLAMMAFGFVVTQVYVFS